MKALIISFAVATLTVVSAAKADTAQLEAQAQKAYDNRDYTPAGRQAAQQASDLFGSLVAQTTDVKKKAEYMIKQAASCFFLGDSTQDNNEKINKFGAGLAVSDAATKLLGVKDVNSISEADIQVIAKRSKDDITELGEALYVRGINLGQWGVATGVMASLDKWPELRATMELIVKIGAKQLHEYGAYRTLGRAYFKIPALLGGDEAKAAKYLQACVNGSLAPGQTYSVNGYNNLFYAELLKDQGQDAQAKKLLQDFLKADANTVLPGYAAESREAQRQAREMLNNW